MHQITSGRLALAVSSLSLVVAMGGVTYAAATIGTAQLKNNAVTSAKIKNNTVTGKDVKESSLKKVPRAAKANSATTAGNVGGIKITKVNYQVDVSGPTTVFSGSGLTLTASCTGGDVTLTASTSVSDASIYAVSFDDSDYAEPLGDDNEGGGLFVGNTFDLLAGGDGNINFVSFEYDTAAGNVVTGQLAVDENGVKNCAVTGMVTSG